MKSKKILAMLLTVMMVISLVPTMAFAEDSPSVNVVSTFLTEISTSGVIYKEYHDSDNNVLAEDIEGAEKTFNESISDQDVQNYITEQETAYTNKANALGLTFVNQEDFAYAPGTYTIMRDQKTFYSSEQFITTTGNPIIVGDPDDLYNAFIAGGSAAVGDELFILETTVYQSKLYAVMTEEVDDKLVTSISVTDLDAPVVGQPLDFTLTATSNIPGAIADYYVAWHVADDETNSNGKWVNPSDDYIVEEGKYYYPHVDITLADGYEVPLKETFYPDIDYYAPFDISGGVDWYSYSKMICVYGTMTLATTDNGGEEAGEVTPPADKPVTSPETGDNSNPAVLVTLMLLSLATVISIAIVGKKKKIF